MTDTDTPGTPLTPTGKRLAALLASVRFPTAPRWPEPEIAMICRIEAEARERRERVDPDLRAVVIAYLAHMDAREPFDSETMRPGDGRHFDGDGCFAALERAAADGVRVLSGYDVYGRVRRAILARQPDEHGEPLRIGDLDPASDHAGDFVDEPDDPAAIGEDHPFEFPWGADPVTARCNRCARLATDPIHRATPRPR